MADLASVPQLASGAGEEPHLAPVVEALCAVAGGLQRYRSEAACRRRLPSRSAVAAIVERLRAVLFPGYFGNPDLSDESMRFHVGANLDRVATELRVQVERGLAFHCEQDPLRCGHCGSDAGRITASFVASLPRVRELLASDVAAAFQRDPAASHPDEAIFCYPGLLALTSYRLAHELHRLGVPLIPRMVTEQAHSQTGIDIHPGARIGAAFFIDHGTGVVIGETAVIGAGVSVYQGVTLGAKSFPRDEQGRPVKGIIRHPRVEDDVVIYSGATILGRVTIGRGSVIGGNVWLTRSVPPGSRVTQAGLRHEAFSDGAGI